MNGNGAGNILGRYWVLGSLRSDRILIYTCELHFRFTLLTLFTRDSSMTVEYMQAADFEALVTQEAVVVADFTASWCGPCKLVAPLMDQLDEAFAGQASIVKVDLDANKALAKEYSIKSIPAVLFFKDGVLAETLVGVKPYSMFEETLKKYL